MKRVSLKLSILLALALATTLPTDSKADNCQWMAGLNVYSHSEPYGYRYDLMDRFGYSESDVIYVLDRVREPADAYMIFRLSELSHRPFEMVLQLYRERRYATWDDLAYVLGVAPALPTFVVLHREHDMPFRHRPPVRYEVRNPVPQYHPYREVVIVNQPPVVHHERPHVAPPPPPRPVVVVPAPHPQVEHRPPPSPPQQPAPHRPYDRPDDDRRH